MKYATALLVSVLFFVPLITGAQSSDSGLVPCGYGDDMCTTEDAVDFANGLIEFLISMLGVIAVIALVYAGFRMVISRGDTGAWRKAKDMFTNIVIGIIIILAAWLVVDTILKGLTEKGLDEWSSGLFSNGTQWREGVNTRWTTGGGF